MSSTTTKRQTDKIKNEEASETAEGPDTKEKKLKKSDDEKLIHPEKTDAASDKIVDPKGRTTEAASAIDTRHAPKSSNPSDSAKADDDAKYIVASIDQLVSSFQMMEFIQLGAREIHSTVNTDIWSLLGHKDEFTLKEIKTLPQYYVTWEDVPNRKVYICRNPEHFVNFTKISEYYTRMLEIQLKRFESALIILREPPSLVILNERVSDPIALGYPMEKLSANGVMDDTILAIIERACKPENRDHKYVELRCLGDPGAIEVNYNLINYSMNKKQQTISNKQHLTEGQKHKHKTGLNNWDYLCILYDNAKMNTI